MESEDCILCVGRNRRNSELLSQVLQKAGYAVKVALNYEEIMSAVEASAVNLVLLDITGFDEEVWQVLQVLRSRAIPFFIITAPNQAHIASQYNATHSSLAPILVKPLSIRSLLTLVAHSLQR